MERRVKAMKYDYCPKCGSKLNPKAAGDDGEVPFCTDCNKYWFDSFSSCVIVLTYNEYDEIVLCRQSYLSDKYSTLTSGYMTPGENAEEAALREVREELGIELKDLEYGGTYWFEIGDMLMHAFMGFSPKCELKISPELDNAEWVPAAEAHKTMFPDCPGNAAHALLRMFLKKRGLS